MGVRRLLTSFALALIAAVVLIGSSAMAAPSAPAFTLRLLADARTFDSRALIGKDVLVLRFQASWCRVCVEEAPGLQRIYLKYKPRGVEVVGIQVQDTAEDASRFLKAHGATYPAGLDPYLRIANRFGVKGTPYIVVIDKRGEVAARIRGRADEARLARVLDPLLKEPFQRKPPARLQ